MSLILVVMILELTELLHLSVSYRMVTRPPAPPRAAGSLSSDSNTMTVYVAVIDRIEWNLVPLYKVHYLL